MTARTSIDQPLRPAVAATLNDVARHAGVSPATASRAINGREGVRAGVRERVLDVARSLGYRPNKAARRLATGEAATIAFVMPSSDLVEDIYVARFIQSFAEALAARDQSLVLHLVRPDDRHPVERLVKDGIVDGIVVSAMVLDRTWITHLQESGLPSVIIGGHADPGDIPVIDTESVESTAALVRHLYDTGRREIAYVHGCLDRNDAVERLRGYALGLQRVGLPYNEALVANGNYLRPAGAAATESLLSQQPDAIICANDLSALGALDVLRREGVRVPDDVAVAGFDGVASCEPQLTSVHQAFPQLAQLAIDLLGAMAQGDTLPARTLIPPRLVIGDTTRPSISSPLPLVAR